MGDASGLNGIPNGRDPKRVETLHLRQAYSHLFADAAVKTLLGGVIGAALMFRCSSLRRSSALLGSGVGLGYAAKEADIYLRQPSKEHLPNTLDQFTRAQACASSFVKTCWDKITGKGEKR